MCSPTDCTLLAVCSPTEFTEYTEPSCCIFSHRLHRFSQMLLSRGCTSRGALQGGALVSSAPISSIYAPISSIYASISAYWYTNLCSVGALLLCWCTSCSGKRQSRAETSAPPGYQSISCSPCSRRYALQSEKWWLPNHPPRLAESGEGCTDSSTRWRSRSMSCFLERA